MQEAPTRPEVKYEEEYHLRRHESLLNDSYYQARAEVAMRKFFSGYNIANMHILDFGCGFGQNIYLLPNAVGYDISQFSLKHARRKGIKVTDDLDNLEDESFDLVFSSHVLEHHPYPKIMIQSMRSKLKKGKELYLVIPHERHGKASFELDLNQHLYNWNFQNINNLLLTSGFEILENRYLRGIGYDKLLPLHKISFELYYRATNLVSRFTGIKELMVRARKV